MSILKIELEVDDLITDMYQDQEIDLSTAIKSQIVSHVSRTVISSINDKVNEEILLKVSNTANEMIGNVVNSVMEKALAGGTLKTRNGDISVDEHILSLFNKHHDWNSPEKYLERKAKEFAAEMKARADVIFATKIVMSIKDQGLLKDGVAEMLIGTDTK